ncbi:MAG: PQQ-binding-like beta-propeller repeat protein [Bryobacterales bacterium]
MRGLTCQPKSQPVIVGDMVYFNGWTAGNDPGEQVELPAYPEVAAKADANHDGKLSKDELPPEWRTTGKWRGVDLDRDGLMNEREWTFFRTRRASRNGLFAVKLGGHGNVTETNVVWSYDKSLPDVPTPLIYQGVAYLIRNGGILTTLDARTGEVLKRGRVREAMEDYYASPVAADGKVYLASERGKVIVLRAGGDGEVLAVNDLGSPIFATPALVEGRIYVRTRDALYAFGR